MFLSSLSWVNPRRDVGGLLYKTSKKETYEMAYFGEDKG